MVLWDGHGVRNVVRGRTRVIFARFVVAMDKVEGSEPFGLLRSLLA